MRRNGLPRAITKVAASRTKKIRNVSVVKPDGIVKIEAVAGRVGR